MAPPRLIKPKFFDSVIPVIIIAIVLGSGSARVSPRTEAVPADSFPRAYQFVHRLLSVVVTVIPLAVFCVLAKIVGSSGMRAASDAWEFSSQSSFREC